MTLEPRRNAALLRYTGVLLGALLLVALLPGAALAAATVTSATGGTGLSADTAGTSPGNGTYAALTGPSIAVTTAGDIGLGTITITAPAGFEFATGAPSPTIGVGATGTVASFTGATTSVVTFTVTTANTAAGTVTIGGLRVRPIVGTPLAAAGELSVGGTAGVSDATAGSLTEVPGAPVLSYQTAPSTSGTAGTALATQPVVLSQDQFGNVRSGDSVTLTSVPSTGGFSCTTNPVSTNGSGLATFAGCKFNVQGSYVIRAAATGATNLDSATIIIAAAPATKLVFTTQPGHGTPGTVLSPQPVVAIQDNFGNTVTSASATILLTKVAPDLGGPGALVGCSTAATVNGVATFTGCQINAVGVGYKLTATDNTGGGAPHPYAPATSAKFDVPDRLVFTTQPNPTASAGVVFVTQPVVAVRAGATDTAVNDATTAVTLSLSGGPAGAVLTCTTNPLTDVAGVATFAGCKIDKIGTYNLVATAPNLGVVASATITITAGPATKLGFTAQPNAGVAAQPFPIQPVVAVQDAGGNTVTTSTATITLSLAAGAPAGSVLTCTGGLSKAAVAGVATFAGCSVNLPGTYTLIASTPGLTSATGTPFVVTLPGAAITLTNSASVITWGGSVVLTVQFGAGGANRTFNLEGARDGVTFTTRATLTTNAAGLATFTYRPATNLYYRAVFAGVADLAAGTSNTTRTVVRQIALLRPTNFGAIKSIARNTSITFTTTARPARPELPPVKVSFVFYRRIGSVWTRVTKRDVFINSAGKASTTFKFTTAGSWYVRSIANPTPFNANSVWSPLERYTVRR